MTKSLKKRVSRGLRFGAQNEAQNLCFSLQKTRFSEQTAFQKMNPKITKNLKNVPPGRTRFGPQNGPQNGSKSSPKLDLFLDPFLVQFWGRFWAAFGCHLGPKTGPGEVWRSLREPSGAPRGQKDNFQKSGFRRGLSAFFHS